MERFYSRINKIFTNFKELNDSFRIFKSIYGEEFEFFNFIFLCGGNSKRYTSRGKIKRILGKKYQILLAEKFINCRGNLDLLSFERIFEAISSSVMICVESAGTFCELGAFTQLSDENNGTTKEIIIYNKDEKKKGSFINKGPISIIKSIDSKRVIYADFYEGDGDRKSGFDINKKLLESDTFTLLNKSCKLHAYYNKPDGTKDFLIKDLTTFLAVLLDLTCYIGYINSRIALDFIRTIYDVNKIYLDCEGFVKISGKVAAVCDTFFMILTKMKILTLSNRYKEKLYFINAEEINKQVQKKWYGTLLFNKSFYSDELFVLKKADFRKALELL